MLTWSSFREDRKRHGRPFVVAHRGASSYEPENTLASFYLGLKQGADALETDLHFTRDDQIVLYHDATLDRTTDGQGTVRDHTLLELKRFRTRAPDGRLSSHRVPSLVELLTMTQGQTPLLLELKDPRFAQDIYAAKLVETLAVYGALERCAIISFKTDLVCAVNRIYPAMPTGHIMLWPPLPPSGPPIGPQLLGPYWPLLYLNPAYVAWAHRKGAIVAPLDSAPNPRLNYYLKLGVDALLADDPASLIAELERT